MIYLVLAAVLIVLPLLVTMIIMRRYQHKGKAFLFCLFLQALVFYAGVHLLLKGAGDAAYHGAGFAAIAVSTILAGLIGPGAFIVSLLILNRPDKWQKKAMFTVTPYLILLVVYLVPGFLRFTGLPPYSTNVDFHGVVLEKGNPLANAKVEVDNCDVRNSSKLTTNDKGEFRVLAYCDSYMFLQRIIKPEGVDCRITPNSSSRSRTRDPAAIFTSFSGSGYGNWKQHTAGNPFIADCE